MEFLVNQSSLSKGLSTVGSVIDKRHAVPILGHVKMHVFNGEDKVGKLVLTTTDTEIMMSVDLQVAVMSEGSTTVSASTLYEVVKKMPDNAQINITLGSDAVLRLKIDGADFQLPTLSVEEFPSFIVTTDEDSRIVVDSREFKNLLNSTKYAIAHDDVRYYLNGLYLHTSELSDNSMVLSSAATDIHRLSKNQMKMEKTTAASKQKPLKGLIIAKKGVGEIIKMIESREEPLSIYHSSHQFMVKLEDAVMITKVLDAKYPDYQKVIPEDNNHSITIGLKQLINAIELVTAVLSFSVTRVVKLKIKGNKIFLSASCEMTGNASGVQELDVDYSGEEIVFGFNSKYFLEALAAIHSVTSHKENYSIRLCFNDSGRKHLVLMPSSEDENWLHLLMSVKI